MSEEPKAIRPVVKTAAREPFQELPAGRKAAMQVLLGPADGAPHFALRRFRMEAGGGMPLHTNRVEHEQYVLSGRGRVRIGKETYDVRAGDVLLIPAGTPHSYEVLEAPFEFLCIVPNEPDQVELVSRPD